MLANDEVEIPAPIESHALSTKDSKELMRMANQLAQIARKMSPTEPRFSAVSACTSPAEQVAIVMDNDKKSIEKISRKLYADRRSREKIFGKTGLFGEPAWDILLDLTIAYTVGKSISVTSASIGSSSPLTTALRWLSILEESGLIVRHSDNFDKRRAYVKLSEAGYTKMLEYYKSNNLI